MFCKNCGTQLPDGAVFCGSCGTRVEAQPAPQQPAYEAVQQPAYETVQQPAYETVQQPAYETVQQPAYAAPQQPVYVEPAYIPQSEPVMAPVREQVDPELDELAKSTLIMGIVGLALSELGLPGLIISNIAMNKAAEFERRAGSLYGKAKVGRRLAKPGKIVGIIMTIFLSIYISIAVIAGIASAL